MNSTINFLHMFYGIVAKVSENYQESCQAVLAKLV